MERSFLDYAMSVIVARALPDVRDGLKPVHRRILWGMDEQGFRPDRPFVKCARVTGDVDGQVPPPRRQRDLRRPGAHGPAVLPAPPADRLPRQLRLARLRPGRRALHRVPPGTRWPCSMLDGIDEDTVDFSRQLRRRRRRSRRCCRPASRTCWSTAARASPSAWPPTSRPTTWARSSTPPSTCSTTPRPPPDDLMQFVKGPDFPTGGLILGRAGIIDAYRTGRGSIKHAGQGRDRGGASAARSRSWSPSCPTR